MADKDNEKEPRYTYKYARCIEGTNIMLLPRTKIFYSKEFDNNYVHPFYAVGKMLHIINDKEFDIVVAAFGGKVRKMYVSNIMARKQIILLKQRQFFWVYGYASIIETKNEKGKAHYWRLTGLAFLHFYTPLLAEVESSEKNDALVEKLREEEAQIDLEKLWDKGG